MEKCFGFSGAGRPRYRKDNAMTFILFDAEYRVDHEAHARYLAAERTEAAAVDLPERDPRVTPRWPFRRPVAISWMTLAPDEQGIPTPVTLRTMGCPEHTEAEMLRAFFADISSVGDMDLVSWGGAGTDLPQLMLSASMHGITLPECLQAFGRPFDMRDRRHTDLMLAMGHSGARVHMAEMAAALDIPVKPIGAPAAVAGYIEVGKWSLVKATAEADVLTLGCLLAYYLQLTTPSCAASMCDRIANYAAKMPHRPFAQDFLKYRDRLRAAALAEAQSSYHRLAA